MGAAGRPLALAALVLLALWLRLSVEAAQSRVGSERVHDHGLFVNSHVVIAEAPRPCMRCGLMSTGDAFRPGCGRMSFNGSTAEQFVPFIAPSGAALAYHVPGWAGEHGVGLSHVYRRVRALTRGEGAPTSAHALSSLAPDALAAVCCTLNAHAAYFWATVCELRRVVLLSGLSADSFGRGADGPAHLRPFLMNDVGRTLAVAFDSRELPDPTDANSDAPFASSGWFAGALASFPAPGWARHFGAHIAFSALTWSSAVARAPSWTPAMRGDAVPHAPVDSDGRLSRGAFAAWIGANGCRAVVRTSAVLAFDDMHGSYFHGFHNVVMRVWATAYEMGLVTCSARACTVREPLLVVLPESFDAEGNGARTTELLTRLTPLAWIVANVTELSGVCFERLVMGLTTTLDLNTLPTERSAALLGAFNVWAYGANGLAVRDQSPLDWRRLDVPVLLIADRTLRRGWAAGTSARLAERARARGIRAEVITFETATAAEVADAMERTTIFFGVTGANFVHTRMLRAGAVSIDVFVSKLFGPHFTHEEYSRLSALRGVTLVKWQDDVSDETIFMDDAVFDALLDQALALGVHVAMAAAAGPHAAWTLSSGAPLLTTVVSLPLDLDAPV